ncbi:efflux RND transporter periplasmic adaptor subunit [bacterium]|nr:efflux RND transporter periplasmic adaptor subunit [bacterium]
MSLTKLPKGVLPLAILVLGVLGAVIMIKLRPEPAKRPAMVMRPVVRVHVVEGDAPAVIVSGYGTVRSAQRVQITPQVTGNAVYKSPALEIGGAFAKGDVLLRIEETDYRLAAEIAAAAVARSEYEQARATQEAEIARREWREIQAADPDRRVRPNPLVLHGPQLKLAEANLMSARASLAKAELDLERCTLRAPFSGRVVSESVDVGQYVRAGTPVGEIFADASPEVTVPLDDADLAFFDRPGPGRDGAPAEIVAEYAGAERVWRGHVARLSGALDPRTRMVDVVVAVDEDPAGAGAGPPLMEGLFVEVRLLGRRLPGAVEIPRAALREGGTVWVAVDPGRVSIRPVVVARKGHDTVLVTEGLSAGDAVIVSNLDIVTEGMDIRVAGAPREPVAPAGGERP